MSTEKSPLHQAALDWAARGLPVFPCTPGTKKPLKGSRGFLDATTDIATIDAWWTQDPDRNVAIYPGPAGIGIVDTDPPDGEANFQELERVHGSLPTRTHTTPRGGRHRLYRGHLPPSAGNMLGPGIDTRGDDSYICVPPSVVNGVAYVADDTPIADLPPWISEMCTRRSREDTGARVDLDKPHNLARAKAWLDKRPNWDSGSRNASMTSEAGMLLACGLSTETAMALMLERNMLQPDPLPEYEIERCTVLHMEDYDTPYAEEEAISATDTFKDLLPEKQEPEVRRFKRWTIKELRELPPPSFLIPDILPARAISVLYGPQHVGKTHVAVKWSLDLQAQGHEVLYYAGEGEDDLAHFRTKAWENAHQKQTDHMTIATEWPDMAIQAEIDDWCAAMKEQGPVPGLIVIDTYAYTMHGEQTENKSEDVRKFIDFGRALKRQWNSGVLLIAHSGKDSERGVRGSNALPAAADCEWRVESHEALNMIQLENTKMRSFKRHPGLFYKAMELPPSIVLAPMAATDAKALLSGQDPVGIYNIRRALGRLLGAEGGVVSVTVLAKEIRPQQEGEQDDVYDIVVKHHVQLLKRAVHGRPDIASLTPDQGGHWAVQPFTE